MELLVLAGEVVLKQHRARDRPRPRLVAGRGQQHRATAVHHAGAGVQQLAAGSLHRSVRGGDDARHRRLPGAPAVARAPRPAPQPGAAGLFRDLAAVPGPRVDLRRLPAVERPERIEVFPGRVGEPAHHQRAGCQLDDARVAVVERCVVDDHRRRPGLTAVAAPDQERLAVGADVLLAVAGEDDQHLPARAGRDRRPRQVVTRHLADRPAPENLCHMASAAEHDTGRVRTAGIETRSRSACREWRGSRAPPGGPGSRPRSLTPGPARR